ncbi:YdbL family protein [Henriciella sp.]|uniref:YdbL family protein n=1 Tax=Henriciella sp. TaxID=1968823 RepID=UPI002617185E|nr:YdbL family protein [Henriciella sp.]
MTAIFRILAAALIIAGGAAVLSAPASAGDPQIEAAKDQGVVGERIDGYLGIVDGGADASLMRRVKDINNKRRAAYDDLAKQTNTTTEQVARVTGEKLVSQAGPGEYVMDESGSWSKK